MAGDSLKAALIVNFSIGVIKTIVGLISGSAAMIAEAYHSFADTFNQILLALGIRRSKREPDLEHPFGYKKVQFFWAFVVAILIFGISGSLAFFEGIEILRHPEAHGEGLNRDFFIWQILVLVVASILEAFALRTAIGEARKYQEELGTETFMEAVDEMQDPVLLSLLVEDSLALIGLLVALIGSIITFVTHNPIIDGITSLLIGIVLMIGGLMLARENKTYLVGKSVTHRVQKEIKDVLNEHDSVKRINTMRTMLLGPNELLLALDVVFTKESKKDGEIGVADDIDSIEEELCKRVPMLKPDRIYIESQLEIVEEEQ